MRVKGVFILMVMAVLAVSLPAYSADATSKNSQAANHEKKQDYERHVKEKMDEFDKRVETYEQEAGKEGTQLNAKFKAGYKEQKAEAQKQFEKVKTSSEKSWKKFKGGMDNQMGKLKGTLDEWASNLRKK